MAERTDALVAALVRIVRGIAEREALAERAKMAAVVDGRRRKPGGGQVA